MEIIPAILTDDPGELKEKIEIITKASRELVRRVQIDIVDPRFAANKTVGLEALEGIGSDLLFDIQLMVQNPVDWVEKSVSVMGDRIIGHVEQMPDQNEFIARVTRDGQLVGLGLDIHTPVKAIEDVLSDLDVVLLMAVEVGFGGQEFDNEVIKKIKLLGELRRAKEYRFNICVDGGVNEENIVEIAEAGADEVAVGKSLWVDGQIEGKVESFLKLVSEQAD